MPALLGLLTWRRDAAVWVLILPHCAAQVGIMLWSGSTVLEKGSSSDPKVSYLSEEWWAYELSHLTW